MRRFDDRREFILFQNPISCSSIIPTLNLPGTMVVSSHSEHNATTLYEKSHSYGPDFVSVAEGIYCNMETHETLRLCFSSVTGDCFDVDIHSHVIGDGSHKPSIRSRNPTNVIHW